jgi:hypothetical protein
MYLKNYRKNSSYFPNMEKFPLNRVQTGEENPGDAVLRRYT